MALCFIFLSFVFLFSIITVSEFSLCVCVCVCVCVCLLLLLFHGFYTATIAFLPIFFPQLPKIDKSADHSFCLKLSNQFVVVDLSYASNTEEIRREIEMLKACEHKNIVSYYGSTVHNDQLWVICSLAT